MASGVLLDIDGVLTVSWEALPGAVETVRWLQEEGIEFRLVTNTSSKSRREIANLLNEAGMPLDVTCIMTAVTSAATYLGEHHPGARCLVLNEGEIQEDLNPVELAADYESAAVVLLGGAGPSMGYAEFDAVFKLAVEGIAVVALHRNARYQTSAGPALDMGAFIVGIEAAADVEIPVVGKPAAAFFQAALTKLGVGAQDAIMVGDDIGSDVLGAQAVGMTGVLVRTGKFRPSDLDGGTSQPAHVIAGIGDLRGLLQGLS
jgi:HAD superfamily hydrolase (TIGR01458 family)